MERTRLTESSPFPETAVGVMSRSGKRLRTGEEEGEGEEEDGDFDPMAFYRWIGTLAGGMMQQFLTDPESGFFRVKLLIPMCNTHCVSGSNSRRCCSRPPSMLRRPTRRLCESRWENEYW